MQREKKPFTRPSTLNTCFRKLFDEKKKRKKKRKVNNARGANAKTRIQITRLIMRCARKKKKTSFQVGVRIRGKDVLIKKLDPNEFIVVFDLI